MGKYIKSHSNFVVKSRHKDLQTSTIWERDITTIGGIDQYAKGQIPIYRSGNFVITIRNDGTYSRDIAQTQWASNELSGDTWTQSALSAITSGETFEDENDLLIKPKQDYYDLRNFAYYGSCVELVRGSINGILQTFPGELYCEQIDGSGRTMVYYDYSNGWTEGEGIFFGDEDNPLYLVSNPFYINIHSQLIGNAEKDRELKYFCNNGYENYEIVTDGEDEPEEITGWTTTYEGDGSNLCPGSQIATITINDLNIMAYLGNNAMVYYFVDSEGLGQMKDKHIRPKRKFFVEFYNNLTTFQKLLLNLDSTPLYTATFKIIYENSYGYYTQMENFEFPKDAGGYNLSTVEEEYSSYIQRLTKIGQFYDERFSDNLWRSMTHEAIKNFDWSFQREYTAGDDEENVEGGQKIQKMLHLYAREFDECKVFIDSIQNSNCLSYDERSNLPDYFLSDLVALDGWDIKAIYPYVYTEPNIYDQQTEGKVKPYFSKKSEDVQYGYFPDFCTEDGLDYDPCSLPWESEAPESSVKYIAESDTLLHLIRPYVRQQEYTYRKVNKEFLKRLKLNSKQILRHKGTIEGVEMALALFGLKSKRWVDRIPNSRVLCDEDLAYDYEITEYVSLIKEPIKEKWDKLHNEYRLDWVNSTKLIEYSYAREGITYLRYQGLPLSYRDIEGSVLKTEDDEEITDFDGNPVKERYLYPRFDSSEQLDGNPYYQMNGGWESKKYIFDDSGVTFQFDRFNNFVSAETRNLYHETIRNIKCVDNVEKLLSINPSLLYDGSIYYVYKLNDYIAAVDGHVYPVEEDEYSASNEECCGYIDMVVMSNSVSIGDAYLEGSISTYDHDGEIITYNLNTYGDGYHIKGYIWNDKDFKFIAQVNGEVSIQSFGLFKYQPESGHTHYFYLNSVNDSNRLDLSNTEIGWRNLMSGESLYQEANISHDYYLGNNPHNGNGQYDNGLKYMDYYEQIFNHALDNELFDERCYGDDYYYSVTEEIPEYGFSGLSNGVDVIDQEDDKISFFGNYRTPTSGNSEEFDYEGDGCSVFVYSDEVDQFLSSQTSEETATYGSLFKVSYQATDTTVEDNEGEFYYYSIDGKCTEASSDDEYCMGGNSGYTDGFMLNDVRDQTTNQIVNNKHLKLTFHLPKFEDNNVQMACLKYYDDVILPVVEQMIPSTSIFEVVYTTVSGETYTITWNYNDDKGTVKYTTVVKGEKITSVPTPPDYGKYQFTDWGMTESEIKNLEINGDMSFSANYEVVRYKVTWEDIDGNGASTSEEYDSGTTLTEASYPSVTPPSDKTFVNWDKPSVVVNGDVTITAQWEEIVVNTFTLRLINADSAPSVRMNGQSVAVKKDGEDYIAVYTSNDPNLTEISDITVSGGLKNDGKPEYDFDATATPDTWNLEDSTTLTYTVTATEKVSNKHWGDTPSIAANNEASMTAESEETTKENLYSVQMPSWVTHDKDNKQFTATQEYSAGQITIYHSKDRNLNHVIQIIPRQDEPTYETQVNGIEWIWTGDTIYTVPSAGKNVDVIKDTNRRATVEYKVRTIIKHSDGSPDEYGKYTYTTVEVTDDKHTANPSTIKFPAANPTANPDSSSTLTASVTIEGTGFTDTNVVTFTQETPAVHKVYWMNGSTVFDSKEYAEGTQIQKPTSQPSKSGATFKGWSKSEGGSVTEDYGVMGTSDIYFYAVFDNDPEPEYTFYISNTQQTSQTISIPSTQTTLSTPIPITSLDANGNQVEWTASYQSSKVSGVVITNDSFNFVLFTSGVDSQVVFTLTQERSNKKIIITVVIADSSEIMFNCDYVEITYEWQGQGYDLDTATALAPKDSKPYTVLNEYVGQFADKTTRNYLVWKGDNTGEGQLNSEFVYILGNKLTDNWSNLKKNNIVYVDNHLANKEYAAFYLFGNWFSGRTGSFPVTLKAAGYDGVYPSGTLVKSASTTVTVSSYPFINENQIKELSPQPSIDFPAHQALKLAYTWMGIVRYYPDDRTMHIIPNTSTDKTYSDVVDMYYHHSTGVDAFKFEPIDEETKKYFQSCDMVRERSGSTYEHYANYVQDIVTSRLPQSGGTLQFKLQATINGKQCQVHIDKGFGETINKDYGYNDTIKISYGSKTGEDTVTRGPITGYIKHPDDTSANPRAWLQFTIGNNMTLVPGSQPQMTNTPTNINQIASPEVVLDELYIIPSTGYILYNQNGQLVGCWDNNGKVSTNGLSVRTKQGVCSQVTIKPQVTSGSFVQINQKSYQNVTTAQTSLSYSITNTTVSDGWKQDNIVAETTDSNFKPSVLSIPIYRETGDPLIVKINGQPLRYGQQIVENANHISSANIYPDTYDITINKDVTTANPTEIVLDFNRPVTSSNYPDKFKKNGESYSDTQKIVIYSDSKSNGYSRFDIRDGHDYIIHVTVNQLDK